MNPFLSLNALLVLAPILLLAFLVDVFRFANIPSRVKVYMGEGDEA